MTVPKAYGSVWQQGATACREGVVPDANPFEPNQYDWLVWMNGWCFAYHQLATEPRVMPVQQQLV